jgi:hypothetical protein
MFVQAGQVGGGAREDELLEDFADQCTMIARKLP